MKMTEPILSSPGEAAIYNPTVNISPGGVNGRRDAAHGYI